MKCFVVQSLCLTFCNPMDCSKPNFPVLNYLLAYAQTPASQVVQRLKHLPTMQESWVQSLGWEDPMEKEMATHSSILAWKSHGQRSLVGYTPRCSKESDNWATSLSCSNSYSLSQCCHPTISSSVNPLLLFHSVFSRVRVFSNELALLIRWPKYWSFSFSISPSNEYSSLISFRID